jgi:hypothetical protein
MHASSRERCRSGSMPGPSILLAAAENRRKGNHGQRNRFDDVRVDTAMKTP